MLYFHQAIQWSHKKAFVFEGDIDDAWMQGRAAFGGLGVGAALHVLKAQCSDHERILSLNASFLAPLRTGKASLKLQMLRKGKNIAFWQAKITQEQAPLITMLVTIGQDRQTSIPSTKAQKPNIAPFEELIALPFIPGLTPNFTQHFDYRWEKNNMPFSGNQKAAISGWIRPKGNPKITESEIAGMMDAWPPPILMCAKKPSPASTIQWQLQFKSTPAQSNWWEFHSKSRSSGNGLSHDHHEIWDEHGNLIALSQQLTAEFSSR
ncbi:MAG: hypothetical protein CMK59_00475 [Proteobacteria bacterium]|nr:hypothetical protein [Pseudomonadota bacterium]